MKKFTLKKPDGTEVVLDRDGLVIGYNNREIDLDWLACRLGSAHWKPVGALLGIERPKRLRYYIRKRGQDGTNGPFSVEEIARNIEIGSMSHADMALQESGQTPEELQHTWTLDWFPVTRLLAVDSAGCPKGPEAPLVSRRGSGSSARKQKEFTCAMPGSASIVSMAAYGLLSAPINAMTVNAGRVILTDEFVLFRTTDTLMIDHEVKRLRIRDIQQVEVIEERLTRGGEVARWLLLGSALGVFVGVVVALVKGIVTMSKGPLRTDFLHMYLLPGLWGFIPTFLLAWWAGLRAVGSSSHAGSYTLGFITSEGCESRVSIDSGSLLHVRHVLEAGGIRISGPRLQHVRFSLK